MSVQTADHSTAAMQSSAEGQMALVTGDVKLAKAKYAEAGDYLRRDIARLRKAPEKHLQQFLAATQYYKGGQYQRAYDMAKRIEARFLPYHVGELLSQFLKDAKARSSDEYTPQYRSLISKSIIAEKYLQVIDLLREHPYVLESADFSYWRAVSCEQLGDFRAATLFYAAARQCATSDVGLLLQTIIWPLRLPSEGRLDEAWEYSQHQVELLPHPITFITASIICYRRTTVAPFDRREGIMMQQIGYLEQAWEGYQRLTKSDQEHFDVKPYIAFGLVAGAHTLFELNNRFRAKELCDIAISLSPNSPAQWVIRGLVTEPSEQSITDFQMAISFPDADHVPYAKLAQDAWVKRDIHATLKYCETALTRNSKSGVAGTLYGWIAACKSVLGSPHSEVDALYKKSLTLVPDDPEIQLNYKAYLERTEGVSWHPKLNIDLVKNLRTDIVQQSETRFSYPRRTTPNVDRILQPA